jgi:hypothetical protein
MQKSLENHLKKVSIGFNDRPNLALTFGDRVKNAAIIFAVWQLMFHLKSEHKLLIGRDFGD